MGWALLFVLIFIPNFFVIQKNNMGFAPFLFLLLKNKNSTEKWALLFAISSYFYSFCSCLAKARVKKSACA
jgi:hypothetical protein